MAIKSKSVEGLDELIKAFMTLGDEAKTYVKEASNDAGLIILNKAKSKVALDTGLLKSKLCLRKARLSKNYPFRIFSSVTYEGKRWNNDSGGNHAALVELGHKIVRNGNVVGTVKAQPYLRPAADESRELVIEKVANAMTEALENMGGLKK